VSAVPDVQVRPVDRAPAFAPEASSLAAALVLVLSATTVVLAQFDSRTGSDYQLHTLLLGSDVSLLVLAVVTARGLPAAIRSWRRHACALSGLALGLSMVPGFLVNPSDRGAAALLRLAGAVALALSVGSAGRDGRRLIVGALAVVSLTHVAVALAQRAKDGPLGLGSLGESSPYTIGGHYASTGLTVHPYVLAAWCAIAGTSLLVLWRRHGPSGPPEQEEQGPSGPSERENRSAGGLARIAGVAAFAGIGLTMSRAGAVAGAVALGGLAVSAIRRSDRAWRVTVVAAGSALVLGLAANAAGWASRAGEATTGNVENVSNGRGALIHQAWLLLRDHPVTGVGPGRYVVALSQRPGLVALSTQTPRPVHVTPLLLVVEGGLVVVPALALLALAIGRACRRGGAPAVAVALAMLPFLALDHLAWSYPQGIVLTGLWLGVLDLLSWNHVPRAPGIRASLIDSVGVKSDADGEVSLELRAPHTVAGRIVGAHRTRADLVVRLVHVWRCDDHRVRRPPAAGVDHRPRAGRACADLPRPPRSSCGRSHRRRRPRRNPRVGRGHGRHPGRRRGPGRDAG